MDEDFYFFWLSQVEGIGYIKAKSLLAMTPNHLPSELFSLNLDFSVELPRISKLDIKRLQDSRKLDRWKAKYEKMQEKGIRFVSIASKEYPEQLRSIYTPPLGLFIHGRLPDQSKPIIAIVGARECSPYGKEMAEYFARQLSEIGVQVISGMAKGIDGFAHDGALKGQTPTYAVLGTALDTCYPPCNGRLFRKIPLEGGLISEYSFGTRVHPGNFPMRNRIISGMCHGVIVVEAKKKSGSLITAQLALDAGREVFAVPGRAMDPICAGSNQLIKDGAFLANSVEDILENITISKLLINQNYKKKKILLETTEKMVYAKLRREPKYIDEIQKDTGIPFELLTETLMKLEHKGLCHQVMQNYYIMKAI